MNYVVSARQTCNSKLKSVLLCTTISEASAKGQAYKAFKTQMFYKVEVHEYDSAGRAFRVCVFERFCDKKKCMECKQEYARDAVAVWASGCGDDEFLQKIPAPYGACLLWQVRNKISNSEVLKMKG